MFLFIFSFTKRDPSDYETNCTASYIKTFSDNKGTTRSNIDEYVPLIAKPPSFEMALAELNSRILNVDQHKNDDILSNNIDETNIQDSTPTTYTSPKSSPTIIPSTSSQLKSTAISTSINLASTSFMSLKSLYNEAKTLYYIPGETVTKEPSITDTSENSTNQSVATPLASLTSFNGLSSSSSISESSKTGLQKVRFTLDPIKLNDTKYAKECQDSKRTRLQNANLSLKLQDYALHRSPSDPTVCFLPPVVKSLPIPQKKYVVVPPSSTNPETPPPELPPRERKVRFQTIPCTLISETNSSLCNTLPRNHKVLPTLKTQNPGDSFNVSYNHSEKNNIYANVGHERWDLFNF